MSLEIVICTYNRAADLDGCLEALARQVDAAGSWRVTVVDNNCTDDTAAVVATHARSGSIPGLRRIEEPRQGLTPSRQRGVREAKAEWVAFVDDDCIVDRSWVAAALRFAGSQTSAGGFGGKVQPIWGREPPAYLDRHAWLFAAQDHGDEAKYVSSLVGAGIVLNRQALNDVGWVSEPYLADRTGLGYVSGGDVEICLRLTGSGRALWYVPDLRIGHRISPSRQGMRQILRLASGLGAGAELVSLMGSSDGDEWMGRVEAQLRNETKRHFASIPYTLRGQYPWQDWLIRMAYLSGQRAQHRQLRRNAPLRHKLSGVWG